LLGTLMALGVLAKYNFVVFAGALLLAGLTLPAPRRVILDRRMVLAFAVSAALLAPHLAWLRANWGGVVAALQDKTGLGEDTGLSRLTSGFGQLLRQTVLLLLPIAAAYFLCLGRDCRALFAARIGQAPCSGTSSMPLALLERTGLMLGALMVILVIAGVSRMTAGWLAPGLVLVPPIVFGRLAARGWPEGLAARLGTLAVAVMLIAATVRIACYGAWHGRNLGRDLLFVQAVADIRERGRAERPLIADNLLTAGNLRFYAPELKVTALGMPLFDVGVRNGDAPILVWNASEKMPPYLETYLRRTGADLAHAELVELERNDLHARFRRLAFLELSPESR
jgi:4-amino-4-deoxy-L-arabinose transferase-like glycosyltransferase